MSEEVEVVLAYKFSRGIDVPVGVWVDKDYILKEMLKDRASRYEVSEALRALSMAGIIEELPAYRCQSCGELTVAIEEYENRCFYCLHVTDKRSFAPLSAVYKVSTTDLIFPIKKQEEQEECQTPLSVSSEDHLSHLAAISSPKTSVAVMLLIIGVISMVMMVHSILTMLK